MSDYEFVVFGGWDLIETGPPSRRRAVMCIVELVFTSEKDAVLAAKERSGTWVKRRKHSTRGVEMREGRMVAKAAKKRLACSSCGAQVTKSYQSGTCPAQGRGEAGSKNHDVAEPWAKVHGGTK